MTYISQIAGYINSQCLSANRVYYYAELAMFFPGSVHKVIMYNVLVVSQQQNHEFLILICLISSHCTFNDAK